MQNLQPPKKIENNFRRQLIKLAKTSAKIILSHVFFKKDNGVIVKIIVSSSISLAIDKYLTKMTPWVKKLTQVSLNQINKNSKNWWQNNTSFTKILNEERFKNANGFTATHLQNLQVDLIKSIPRDAALRVQHLAAQANIEGGRASELAERILATEDITIARAKTIARTEISRASATFNQARAEYVGVSDYIWRTAGDEIVRTSHVEVDGQVFSFLTPPTLSDGETGHPGEFVNCRCYAEPIIK